MWTERTLPLPYTRQNHGVHLEWNQTDASYSLPVPEGSVPGWDAVLRFAQMSLREELPDLTVELTATGGARARVPLSRFNPLTPVPPVTMFKLGPIDPVGQRRLLQHFEIPLSDFPGVAPEAIQAVRFRFDRTPVGAILLDDVGFRPAR